MAFDEYFHFTSISNVVWVPLVVNLITKANFYNCYSIKILFSLVNIENKVQRKMWGRVDIWCYQSCESKLKKPRLKRRQSSEIAPHSYHDNETYKPRLRSLLHSLSIIDTILHYIFWYKTDVSEEIEINPKSTKQVVEVSGLNIIEVVNGLFSEVVNYWNTSWWIKTLCAQDTTTVHEAIHVTKRHIV